MSMLQLSLTPAQFEGFRLGGRAHATIYADCRHSELIPVPWRRVMHDRSIGRGLEP